MRANTLRLRLMRSEVDQIAQGQVVAEHTRFPDGAVLSYVLKPSTRTFASMANSATGQEICIEVEAAAAAHWASSDNVGLGEGDALQIGSLEVLVEKDFTCVTPRAGEEELDTYPNPNVASS